MVKHLARRMGRGSPQSHPSPTLPKRSVLPSSGVNSTKRSTLCSVNAYIVFAHASPRGAAEDAHTVHPSDAAGIAMERCYGTMFLD